MAQQKQLEGWSLALFGLPFLLAGLGVMGYGFFLLNFYQKTASWVQVPAKIISIELKRHSGSKGGSTYSVSGSYKYKYKEREYSGYRIVIESGSSSEYSYWNNIFEDLENYRKTGKDFNILVDPNMPQESLAIRKLSTIMIILPIFGAIFAVVGLGLIISGIMGHFASKKKESRIASNPNKPWLEEDKWKNFTIHSGSLYQVLAAWGVGIFLSGFVSIFVIAMSSDHQVPFFAKAIVGVFVLLAVFLVITAIYKTLQHLKYGEATLLLSEVPIALGREFSAVVLVKKHLITDEGVKVALKCVSTLTTRSGKNTHTTNEDLHNDVQMIKEDLSRSNPNRSAIPVRFQVPPDLPSRNMDGNPTFSWKLEIVAETPGINFTADFDLPVYQVDDESLIIKRSA